MKLLLYTFAQQFRRNGKVLSRRKLRLKTGGKFFFTKFSWFKFSSKQKPKDFVAIAEWINLKPSFEKKNNNFRAVFQFYLR